MSNQTVTSPLESFSPRTPSIDNSSEGGETQTLDARLNNRTKLSSDLGVETSGYAAVPVADHLTIAASQALGDIHDIGTILRTAFVTAPEAFAPAPPAVGPSSSKAKSKDRPASRRLLKTLVGLTLLAAFGAYPLYALIQPSSVEAVLNARLVTLRAPISGRVDAIRDVDDAGILARGAELLTIHNDRTDRGRLDELESQKGRLANELAAITAKLRNAEEERVQLDAAVRQFSRGRLAQLQARRAELNDEIAMATLRHEEAAHAASRSAALASGGNISDVEAVRVAREASLAALQTDTLRHRLASLTQEIEAAHAGIFIGDGSNNDRPSSTQRAESVEAEIASFEVERDRLAAELARVSSEIGQDTARYSLLSNAALTVPTEGRMWERLVSPGEEVSSGQAMVRLVDCSTTVVTANVTESVYNGLSVGTAARFIPADDGEDLNGRVVNLTGMANAAANFAIEPSALRKEPYRVLIGFSGSQNASCSIGRTGRVEFNRSDVAAP